LGFFGNVSGRVRNLLRWDKEQIVISLAKGSTASSYPQTGFDLLQAYGYDVLSDYLKLEHDLMSRYVDYEEMDDDPILATALDVYADDATQVESLQGKAVWVDSPDKTVQTILEDLFWRRLRIDEEIWSIARTLAKYGQDYEEMLVTQDGVVGLNHLPPPTIRRIEGRRGELFGFVQDFKGRFGFSPDEFKQLLTQRMASAATPSQNKYAAMEDWEVVHMRLRSKQRRAMYGSAVFEPARWIWKRLMLLEDAAMVYRLQRAPQRYAFYIDVGDLPPKEALAYLHKIRQQYKKTKFYNSQTGKLDLKFNPLPVGKGEYIPLLDGRNITIEEMAKEHVEGKKHWVYSIDRETGKPVPGEVSWVGKTRDNGRALKITFDDGGHAVMAPDHPVMMRDCRYVNAEDLKPGDSVMPLYRRRFASSNYESWYCPETKAYKSTHRVVAEGLGWDIDGKHVHHRDHNRLNNEPCNLDVMDPVEHAKEHAPDRTLDLIAYNKSPEKRRRTTELNRLYDTAQHIRAYNASEQHARDNEIRSKGKTEFWQDEERAAKTRERMHLTFPEEFIAGLRALIRENPKIRAEGVVRAINGGTSLLMGLDSANRRSVKAVHRHMLLKLYRQLGYESFADFKRSCLDEDGPNNHKVVSVEEVEPVDMYCMTVEKWHNFALLLKDSYGNPIPQSGVSVRNSQDEDFFVPVRKGVQQTKIDVVGSPAWQHMEDIEYFRSKLFAAIKIPKVYLGGEAPRAKGTLSQEDVRFARTVLRLQREIRNGLKKIARVHLASLGIDPARVDYEIYMTIPSSIFELAQLEVRNAKADFAGRMNQFVSMHWILSKIFGLSDSEVEYIIKERHQEQLADAEVQAKSMGLQLDVQGKQQMQQAAVQGQIQLQQQAQAAQMQGGQPAKAESGEMSDDLRKYMRDSASLSRMWPLIRQSSNYRPITEQELLSGNRDHEKRMEDSLEQIMESNTGLGRRLGELRELVGELKLSMPSRG